MKIKLVVIASLVLMGAVPAVHAAGGSYFSLDAMNWTFDQTAGTTGKASGTGFRMVYGSSFSGNLGWEAHLGLGGSGATGTALGTISNDALAGFYLRGNIPAGKASAYGLVGFTSARFSNSSSTTIGSGVSYGVGAQYNFSDQMGVHADYMSYVNTGNWSATALSFGVNFNF